MVISHISNSPLYESDFSITSIYNLLVDKNEIYVYKVDFFFCRSTPNGAWSFLGSKLVATSDAVTVCQYDHTTNFAILMSSAKAVSIN